MEFEMGFRSKQTNSQWIPHFFRKLLLAHIFFLARLSGLCNRAVLRPSEPSTADLSWVYGAYAATLSFAIKSKSSTEDRIKIGADRLVNATCLRIYLLAVVPGTQTRLWLSASGFSLPDWDFLPFCYAMSFFFCEWKWYMAHDSGSVHARLHPTSSRPHPGLKSYA